MGEIPVNQYVYLIEQSNGGDSDILAVETEEAQAIATLVWYIHRAVEEEAKAYILKGYRTGMNWRVPLQVFSGIHLRRVPTGTRRFEHVPDEKGESIGWWRTGLDYDQGHVYYDVENSTWKSLYGTTISENCTDQSSNTPTT